MYLTKTKLTFVAALSAVLIASPIIRVSATPPEVADWAKTPFDFTGFYIGMNIGGMLSNYDFSGSRHLDGTGGGFAEGFDQQQQFFSRVPFFGTAAPAAPTPSELVFEDEGFLGFFVPNHGERDGAVMGGAQIGYQHQFGHFVVGVEGSFERTSTSATSVFRDSGSSSFPLFNFPGGQNLPLPFIEVEGDSTVEVSRRAETNWTATAAAKIGYAQGPFLFYFIGGGTWADVKTTAHDTIRTDYFLNFGDNGTNGEQPVGGFLATGSDTNVSKDDDSRFGWTAGGGIEIAASKTVTLALEYRHNDFGSETYHYKSHNGIIFPGSTTVDFDSDQVSLKLNVLLNNLFSHADQYAGTNPDERLTYANIRDGKDAKDKVVQLAPQEVFSWTGPYIGAHVGGVWTDFDFNEYTTDVDTLQQFGGFDAAAAVVKNAPNSPVPQIAIGDFFGFDVATFHTGKFGNEIDSESDAGLIGGGQIGYNYQWGHWVFGAEADMSGSTASGWSRFTDTQVVFVDESPFLAASRLHTERTVETDWSLSLRGRVGYACGRVMLYITGGPVWTDVRVGNNDTASTDFVLFGIFNEGTVVSKNKNKDEDVVMSWTGGGGIEWALTKIASLGLEYRHNFGTDETFDFDEHQGPIFPGSTNVDMEGDQVTLRVNFLLGHLGQ